MTKMLADEQADTLQGELIRRCQQGDAESFRQLYRRYQQKVRATLYQLCDRQMLDDLVQEVFLRVWQGLPKLRQVSHFSTWLYRITWNVASDRRRQLAKNKQKQIDTDEQPILNSADSSPQNSPDLMQLHYQDLVQRALQNLSLEHRAVLILHDLEDIPQKEVAKILNLPVGTVKSRLFYARGAVRKFLQQQGD